MESSNAMFLRNGMAREISFHYYAHPSNWYSGEEFIPPDPGKRTFL